ncbi:MAG: hypothetical protein U0941_22205 [Planctomycetaceae bacterium]
MYSSSICPPESEQVTIVSQSSNTWRVLWLDRIEAFRVVSKPPLIQEE